ncbi:hypothetical protein OGAPHI_006922 [Ogataea philodendri]|uniref:Uncharacterized protein n=1 Tax=Ogataea philodendri TaxID=1378263 RepID=A0A9P8T083_9ASCO|nr:uncharacterized protein OGAPHI_006922 [Ogataea philodendri]KAH3660336.1 hypothetical protein OGAPHI_006922 [Ogataea philodendri]
MPVVSEQPDDANLAFYSTDVGNIGQIQDGFVDSGITHDFNCVVEFPVVTGQIGDLVVGLSGYQKHLAEPACSQLLDAFEFAQMEFIIHSWRTKLDTEIL